MGKRITAEELDKRLRHLGKRSGWTLISMRIDVCGDGEDRDAIVEARYRESEYRLCCSIGPGLMPGPLAVLAIDGQQIHAVPAPTLDWHT